MFSDKGYFHRTCYVFTRKWLQMQYFLSGKGIGLCNSRKSFECDFNGWFGIQLRTKFFLRKYENFRIAKMRCHSHIQSLYVVFTLSCWYLNSGASGCKYGTPTPSLYGNTSRTVEQVSVAQSAYLSIAFDGRLFRQCRPAGTEEARVWKCRRALRVFHVSASFFFSWLLVCKSRFSIWSAKP